MFKLVSMCTPDYEVICTPYLSAALLLCAYRDISIAPGCPSSRLFNRGLKLPQFAPYEHHTAILMYTQVADCTSASRPPLLPSWLRPTALRRPRRPRRVSQSDLIWNFFFSR